MLCQIGNVCELVFSEQIIACSVIAVCTFTGVS